MGISICGTWLFCLVLSDPFSCSARWGGVINRDTGGFSGALKCARGGGDVSRTAEISLKILFFNHGGHSGSSWVELHGANACGVLSPRSTILLPSAVFMSRTFEAKMRLAVGPKDGGRSSRAFVLPFISFKSNDTRDFHTTVGGERDAWEKFREIRESVIIAKLFRRDIFNLKFLND